MDHINPHLCSVCRPLFAGQRKDKELGVPATELLHQTVQQLEDTAAHGCNLCLLRWNQLKPEERIDLRDCTRITYGFWQSRVGDGVVFEYWLDTWEGGMKPRASRSVKLKKRSEVLMPTSGNSHAGASTSSCEALATARQWISDCDQNHAECKRWIRPDPTFLPTRLIQLGKGPSDISRICDGASLPLGSQYIVLSHCWGGEVPLQLKQANLDQYRNAIPAKLPKTFSDAIDVARFLGKQYIWIDSLCIVQDLTEDWQREARLMERIYENAWCSVAATMAGNSSEGLFSTREPVSVRPVTVEAFWHPIRSETYILWDPDIFDAFISDSPLMHRGWVVQERILAPRILHFAHGQIFWECSSLRACETFPHGVPDNKTYKLSMDTKDLPSEMIPYKTPALQLFRLWQKFVDIYSDCGLTKPDKDKFLAISGIARKIGAGDDYAAGLWRSVLIRQLRWSTDGGCSRPTTWRAPSWSWASIDGPIYADAPTEAFLERDYRVVCIIHEVDVKTATDDPFGPVDQGAALKLEAPLLKAMISITKNQYGYPIHWMNNITGNVQFDTRPAQGGETIFCMPLTVQTRRGSEAIYGIVIEPIGGSGQFERCGTFRMAAMNMFDQWAYNASQAFSDTCHSDAVGHPVGDIAGLNWKRYAITLI